MKNIILLLAISLAGCASTAVLYEKDPEGVRECADIASKAADEAYRSCVADKLTQ